jgi:nucleoside-diphosphate-sugar epimerase
METPPTLILVSSLAAAGPAREGRLRVETDPCRPVSDYGKSKLSGEKMAIKYGGNRLPLSIVRPPIVFGAGDRDGFQLFGSIARWGLHMVPTLQDHNFSMIHAEDLATALYETAQSGRRVKADDGVTGTYFVAANEHPTYADFGRRIGQAVGRTRVRVLYNPGISIKTAAAANQFIGRLRQRPQILNPDKAREALAGSWTCSNAALEKDTGFRPVVSLDKRLRQTALWYADQGWLRLKKQTERQRWSSPRIDGPGTYPG